MRAVPGSFPTIQSAIDASADGDIVEVAAGVYAENVDFLGKAIVVRTLEKAVIDAGGSGPCVAFTTGEDERSVLSGFTLRNGVGRTIVGIRYGGGVLCVATSPVIEGNVIRDCRAGAGAGLAGLDGASPTLRDNRFLDNGTRTPTAAGGGAYFDGFGFPTVEGNTFEGNVAVDLGGAIAFVEGAGGFLRSNDFVGNRLVIIGFPTRGSGGAVFVEDGSATFVDNRFESNEAWQYGGGVATISGTILLEGNVLRENRGASFGGGVYGGGGSEIFLRESLFEENQAGHGGAAGADSARRLDSEGNRFVRNIGTFRSIGGGAVGAVATEHLSFVLDRFEDNTTSARGGGIDAHDSLEMLVSRATFTGNIAQGEGGALSVSNPTGTVRIESCSVRRNEAERGGGLHVLASEQATEVTIESTAFVDNRAEGFGGGVWFDLRAGGAIEFCTLADNSAGGGGGAVAYAGSPDLVRTIRGSILYDNTAPEGHEILDFEGDVTVERSIVRGGFPGPAVEDVDPRFVDLASGDVRLRFGSPAIDRVDPFVASPGPFDFEGDPRRLDGDLAGGALFDLGADEADPVVTSRFGSVSAGLPETPLANVLLLNGSTGDRRHEVAVHVRDPLRLEMLPAPSGPNPGRFVLYAYGAVPDASTPSVQPFGLGLATFATPLDPMPAPPREIWNNLGFRPRLGAPTRPSSPAPSIVFDLPRGVGRPTRLTLQGFVEDAGSAADGPLSLTNAIVLEVLP